MPLNREEMRRRAKEARDRPPAPEESSRSIADRILGDCQHEIRSAAAGGSYSCTIRCWYSGRPPQNSPTRTGFTAYLFGDGSMDWKTYERLRDEWYTNEDNLTTDWTIAITDLRKAGFFRKT